ncbi:MAG: hypothetical protein Q9198_005573 [Flavoplaca austrocitrina]
MESHPLPHLVTSFIFKPQQQEASIKNLHSSFKKHTDLGYLNPSKALARPLSPNTSEQYGYMSIENLKTFDPFAEADEDTGETKQSQNYIHIRIQQRNGRKTLTTVQGLPKKFDQKKILKVIKKKFACNGTIVNDTEMGEVIQLQGDQRKDVQEFLVDKKEGLALDAKTIKVRQLRSRLLPLTAR